MKVLVVVDYQNDFVDGALGFDNADKIDNYISEQVKKFARENDHIIVTYDTHSTDYLTSREGKALPVEHCILGTKGHELFGDTGFEIEKLKTNGYVKLKELNKYTFGAINLCNHIKDEIVTEIHLVGLVSNICVLSNAVIAQANFPEAQIVIHTQGIDSFDKETHDVCLQVMKGLQMKLV